MWFTWREIGNLLVIGSSLEDYQLFMLFYHMEYLIYVAVNSCGTNWTIVQKQGVSHCICQLPCHKNSKKKPDYFCVIKVLKTRVLDCISCFQPIFGVMIPHHFGYNIIVSVTSIVTITAFLQLRMECATFSFHVHFDAVTLFCCITFFEATTFVRVGLSKIALMVFCFPMSKVLYSIFIVGCILVEYPLHLVTSSAV